MIKNHILHSDVPTYTKQDLEKNIILSLKNFRTYGSCEVRIPKYSNTLIVGASGVGKTSILEAFLYVLYNGIQKPEKFGTKKCWVWLTMGDITIYRQKDPGLFKIWRNGKEYVNGDAQYFVNDMFGEQKVFLATSYLRQKEFSPFLYGTDSDKMSIIKSVAFKSAESDSIKEPIKERTKELENHSISENAQLNMSINNVKSFDLRNPQIVKQQVPENSQDVLKEVQNRRSAIDQLDAKFEEVVREEAGASVFKQQADIAKSEKDKLVKQLKAIDVEKSNSRIIEIDKKLEDFSTVSIDAEKLAKAQLFKLWNNDKLIFDLKVGELSTTKSSIEKELIAVWGKELLDDEKFIDEKIKLIDDIRQSKSEVSLILSQVKASDLNHAKRLLSESELNLKDAQTKETSIREKLKEIRLSNKMKCPECSSTLIINEDGTGLEKCTIVPSGIGAMLGNTKEKTIVGGVTHDDLVGAASKCLSFQDIGERLQVVIKTCEDKLKFDVDPDKIIPSLNNLKKYKELSLALDNLNSQLELHEKKKPEEITDIPVETKITDKENLEKERTVLENRLAHHESISSKIKELETRCKQFSQMMLDKINNIQINSIDIRKHKAVLQSQIDQLMHLSSASDLAAQRSVLEKTMNQKAEEAKKIDQMLSAVKRLYQKAVEAERIFLQTTVDKINILVGRALQKLFPETPISVELSTTKKLKSKKNAVSQRFDIKIFYRDSEYSSSRQLSGGEKDRVSLAITLAMSETFGSPILFLDETLSSLDPELKAEAVELLKEMSVNKTIVVISHEETEGLYDNVLRLT